MLKMILDIIRRKMGDNLSINKKMKYAALAV